ncbi:MAG: CHASE domain-containing protein [Loktanella sp.]|nr:CHASE domain-containing protein [Loktanella sp.]
MTGWFLWIRNDLLRKANVPAVLALLAVTLGWIAVETQARKNHLEAQRASIAAQLAVLRADLESAVNGPIQLVRGLVAVIATEPDMDQTRFADLASGLLSSEPTLRNIAAAPDMIIQLVYPVAGNEQVIGLDYNELPEQRDAALRARDTGDLVLAGPVNLVQGGQGFVGRFPVFLRNVDDPPVYWGLVSTVMNVEVLYARAGLRDDLPFAVTLTGQDATGARGERFYGPLITSNDTPVVARVQLPTGSWQIAAMPHGGWETEHPQIWTIRILLALAAAVILVPSVGMGRSMVQRQRAIEDLEAANSALQQQMNALETARASQEEAEVQLRQSQKLEAVGQLTGGVAHDFNNLLTVILGNAELLTEELGDRAHLRKLAEITANAAQRGSELTSRLLAFSRKQPLQPCILNISDQVQNGLELLLRRTLPESITLHIAHGENLWATEVDPGQLEAALLNIVLNARDAMQENGHIEIAISNATLDDTAVMNNPDLGAGDYVAITITDTGKGMSNDTLSRVFEPFFTTKDVGTGTGLGLSMVYGFVKQSGGHIAIASTPGKGTGVTLYFPRSHDVVVQRINGTASPRIAGGTETIMVVEDDALVREQVCANLAGLGYRVKQAENGPDAIRILQESDDIDLLFTDIILPGGMNGRALADAALELRPDLKVLFTSGYTEDTVIHHGRLDPQIELLSKPYRRSQLADKLRKVLG